MKHVGVQTNPKDTATQDQLSPRYYTGATAPIGTRRAGDRWMNDDGIEAVWLIDADTGQWVVPDSGAAFVSTTSGDIEITDYAKGYILPSPDGTRWRITINNAGVLQTTSL